MCFLLGRRKSSRVASCMTLKDLVVCLHRRADVHGGKHRKDVRLQRDDEEFEGKYQRRRDKGCDTNHPTEGERRQENVDGHERDHDQDMAGSHVCEQPDRQSKRSQNEGTDEFNRRQNDVQGFWNSGWKR